MLEAAASVQNCESGDVFYGSVVKRYVDLMLIISAGRNSALVVKAEDAVSTVKDVYCAVLRARKRL